MRVVYLMAFALCMSIAARGDDWSGNLVDAVCAGQAEKTVSCDATNVTTVFGLDVSGKVYKLDPAGNAKAAAALKYRATPDPLKPPSTTVKATITGTEGGGIIVVETISLQ